MRIAFAGTPAFAATILRALLVAKHDLMLVLTQPDRPAGRGMKLMPSAVKVLALEYGIPVYQPVSLKPADAQQPLRDARPDVLIVAAYGLILPQAVLDIPSHGAINVHASLLPRWRGAAPIQRAILAGDAQTGVTIMQMDAGLDTGYMLFIESTPISQTDTTGSIEERLAQLGANAMLHVLGQLKHSSPPGVAQPSEGVTYAAKIQKHEAALDFALNATQLDRVVRAFNPAPVAHTTFRGEILRIWRAQPHATALRGVPGEICSTPTGAVGVVCGEGWLELLEVQRPGGKPMSATAWLGGARLQAGERLGG